MKEVLTAIYNYLRANPNGYTADQVIYWANSKVKPSGAAFPCIAIKDGRVEYNHLDLNEIERVMNVDVIVYADAAATPANVLTATNGLLALCDNVRAALTDNKLGLAGIESALPLRETPVERLDEKTPSVTDLRKIITMQYKKLEVK